MLQNASTITATKNFAVGNFAGRCFLSLDGPGTAFHAPYGVRLYVGGSQAGNRMLVKNGASVDVAGGNYAYLYVGNGGSLSELRVEGTGSTLLAGDSYIGNASSSNLLIVADGANATFTNNVTIGARDSARANRLVVTNASFSHVKENAKPTITAGREAELVFTGPQTTAFLSHAQFNSGAGMWVLDGAVVTNQGQLNFGNNDIGGCRLVVSNGVINAGYNINAGNWTNDCSIEIYDGGKIYNPSYFFDIGSQPSTWGNTMVVDGEGSFASCSRLRIGQLGRDCSAIVRNGGEILSGSIEIGNTASAISNRIEVLDGGTLRGTSNATLWFGRSNPPNAASNSYLRVSNGFVDLWYGNGTINMRAAGRMRLEGTNTVVKTPIFRCAEESVIEFIPPADAAVVEEPYVTCRGAVTFDETVRLRVLDEQPCARKGGGTYTLLRNTNTDITGTIQNIEASGDVTVTQTAREITIRIANRENTLVLFR